MSALLPLETVLEAKAPPRTVLDFHGKVRLFTQQQGKHHNLNHLCTSARAHAQQGKRSLLQHSTAGWRIAWRGTHGSCVTYPAWFSPRVGAHGTVHPEDRSHSSETLGRNRQRSNTAKGNAYDQRLQGAKLAPSTELCSRKHLKLGKIPHPRRVVC